MPTKRKPTKPTKKPSKRKPGNRRKTATRTQPNVVSQRSTPQAPRLCIRCGKRPVPDQAQRDKKILELAELCRFRDRPFGGDPHESKVANDKWNQETIDKVGSQLRGLSSYIRGFCHQCHFEASTPVAIHRLGEP